MKAIDPLEFSPNWYWKELGFTVVRNLYRRTVFDGNGNEVCDMASYEKEHSIGAWLFFGAVI